MGPEKQQNRGTSASWPCLKSAEGSSSTLIRIGKHAQKPPHAGNDTNHTEATWWGGEGCIAGRESEHSEREALRARLKGLLMLALECHRPTEELSQFSFLHVSAPPRVGPRKGLAEEMLMTLSRT